MPDWKVSLRQWAAMTLLSMRRYKDSANFWINLLLAAIPVGIAMIILGAIIAQFGVSTITSGDPQAEAALSSYNKLTERIFTGGFLHFGLIFVAALFGSSAVRDEMSNRTYHYFLLTPMPRWMLLLGKFTGFLALTLPMFLLSLVTMKLIISLTAGFGGIPHIFLAPEQLYKLAAEFLVLTVAMIVYSAFFLAISSIFRGALVILFIYGWEFFVNLLPEVVRNFSITYHLKAMLPYTASQERGFFGFTAEPPGALQIIFVLTFLFIVSAGFASIMTSRKQCLYGSG